MKAHLINLLGQRSVEIIGSIYGKRQECDFTLTLVHMLMTW